MISAFDFLLFALSFAEFPPDFDIENGALQVTFIRLSIDFYPSNIAGSERSSWVRYTAPNQCSTWNQKILQAHFVKLCSRLGEYFLGILYSILFCFIFILFIYLFIFFFLVV